MSLSDVLEALGLQFWLNLTKDHAVTELDHCQEIIKGLQGHLDIISEKSISNVTTYNRSNCFYDCDSSVMILVMGMIFWRNTIEDQNIKDLKHCNVILNYLEGFMSAPDES